MVERSSTMQADAPAIPVDPNLATEQAQAQQTQIAGLQNEAMTDTSNLMARYGTLLALKGAGITAGSAVPVAGTKAA